MKLGILTESSLKTKMPQVEKNHLADFQQPKLWCVFQKTTKKCVKQLDAFIFRCFSAFKESLGSYVKYFLHQQVNYT